MDNWKDINNRNLFEVFNGQIINEEWKFIKDYEGYYEVSNFGRVKSLSRKISHPISGEKTVTERILKQYKYSNGYLGIGLRKNNVRESKLVHRLVGEAFIPNPHEWPEINHIKGIKTDNRHHQLEWATISNNKKHAYEMGLIDKNKIKSMLGKVGGMHPNSKKIYCSTLGVYFESARLAEKAIGISQGSISDICNGKRVHKDGLTFQYV